MEIKDEDILHLFKIHTSVRCGIALAITLWLIFVALNIRSIIHLRVTSENFTSEKRRMNVMNWTFIISYTTWSIYEIVICIRSYPSGFIVTETYFLLCIVADIIPITVVLYTHFRNTH